MWSLQPADILLVEDDALDAELALSALQDRNISKNVVHVVDGYEALDYITYVAVVTPGHAPKVILLDLKLKTISGVEVLRQLKAEIRTQTIPVVVFTSSMQEIELVETYRLGVNSYVIKPANHQTFQRAVGDIGYYWLNLNHSPGP
jgi:two-component system response regulator